MPRTFLVERIVDMSSSCNDTETKFKVANDVTIDDGSHDLMDKERRNQIQQTDEQKMMTPDQQRDVAMDTSVIDYRARSAVKLGKSTRRRLSFMIRPC